jgi:uncharacterized repeat protein (TIGR03943 family)
VPIPKSKIQSLKSKIRRLSPWLDTLAISAWGILFLKYWLTGKLYLLIHPNYMGLTIAAGIALLLVAGLKGIVLLKKSVAPVDSSQHLTLFPPGWSSVLLLGVAIFGFIVQPRAFASETATHRGVHDANIVTRVKPQAFRGAENSEDKSIVDWIRTLTVYPEPDAYTGQKAKVQGFVIYPPQLDDRYLLISRFVITCCAADVYPVSLPVKLSGSREAYKPDTWLEIEGQMITETLAGKRQLTLAATSLKPIPEPKNPYDY